MINVFYRLSLFLILLLPQRYEYSNGRPTSLGIDRYINSKANQQMFLSEFQKLVKDTLYNDMFFSTKNFRKTTPKDQYVPNVLAYNESYGNYSCEIVVNNEEKFSGYEYKNNKNKEYYNQNDYFIKPTVFHEIMHYYFYQCILELEIFDSIRVNEYYKDGIIIYPNIEMQFGAKFIEEGICEYLTQSNGEVPKLLEWYEPKTIGNLQNKYNRQDIFYGYASQYLKDFMDYQILKFDKIKYPIMILLKNRPPNYEEILNPDKFFKRLII